jgi:tetratricopeptide (TPR) repeat protein
VEIVALALAAYFLNAIWHELGHCVGAWLSGLRIDGFQIAPFSIQRVNGSWQYELVPAIGVNFAVPSALHVDRARQGIFNTVIGGPAATVVLLIGFLAALATGAHDREIVAGAWMSGLVLATSLWPGVRNGHVSDGLRLWRLLREPEELDRAARAVVANHFAASPDRPRDWDMDSVADLIIEETPEGERYLAAVSLAYFAFLDRGQFVYAWILCESMIRAAEDASGPVRRRILCEAAWFTALHRQELDRARYLLSLALTLPGGRDSKWLALRARAAILREVGRREECAEMAREALAMAPRMTPVDRMRVESLEWLARPALARAAGA